MEPQPAQQTGQQAAQPALPENITSDVVASILGTILGIFLGTVLYFLFAFTHPADDPVMMLVVIAVVFGATYCFARLCYHMDLTGHRLFRQAYSLLTPTIVILYGSMLIVMSIAEKLSALQSTVGEPGAGLSSVIGTGMTMTQLIIWLVAIAIIMLIPFALHARKEERIRISWFWELIIPIVLCALATWLVAQPFIMGV